MCSLCFYAFLWATNNPPNLYLWLQEGQIYKFSKMPISGIVSQSVTLISVLAQLVFRLYVHFKIDEKTNEIFTTKTILISTFTTIFPYLFRLIDEDIFGDVKLETILPLVWITSMIFLAPLQMLTCHKSARKYFLSRHPKLLMILNKASFTKRQNRGTKRVHFSSNVTEIV